MCVKDEDTVVDSIALGWTLVNLFEKATFPLTDVEESGLASVFDLGASEAAGMCRDVQV